MQSGSPKPGMLKRGMTAGNLLRRPDLNSFLADSAKVGSTHCISSGGGSGPANYVGSIAKRCSSSNTDAEVDASVTSLSSSVSTSSAEATVATHDRSVTMPRCRSDVSDSMSALSQQHLHREIRTRIMSQ